MVGRSKVFLWVVAVLRQSVIIIITLTTSPLTFVALIFSCEYLYDNKFFHPRKVPLRRGSARFLDVITVPFFMLVVNNLISIRIRSNGKHAFFTLRTKHSLCDTIYTFFHLHFFLFPPFFNSRLNHLTR